MPAHKGADLQRAFLIDRLAPKRGERILDLGCGVGRELESIVRNHPSVRVVGLDCSKKAIESARRRLFRHIDDGRAELVVGDAGEKLPFPPKHFDAVLSVELFECLPPAKGTQLLKEIHRVLKPGGRVLVEHTDWDTQVWNASDRALARRVVHAFCDWTQGWMESSDGWMGRRLLGLLRRSALFRDIRVSTYVLTNDRYQPGTWGYDRSRDLLEMAKKSRDVRDTEVRRFLADLRRQDRAGAYFYSVNRYIAVAKKR